MERPNLEEEKLVEKIKATWKKAGSVPGPFSKQPYLFYASPDDKFAANISDSENEIVVLIDRKAGKFTMELAEILKMLKDL